MSAIVKAEQGIIVHAPIFNADQEKMIRDTFLNGASREEAAVLLEVARLRRLNPLLKQIHFVKRYDKQRGRDVWASQVSIDGLRTIAERTGKYDGQDEPEYGPLNADGYPSWAKVRVYRKDWSRPAVGLAHWSEYVQSGRDGITRFWKTMGHVMLAKCAEAVAMRKAFPEDMGGLYTDDEMMQTEAPRELPQINAHVDEPEFVHVDDGSSLSIYEELKAIDNSLFACSTLEKSVALRDILGSPAKQTPVLKHMQDAGAANALNAEQRKSLSKYWGKMNRRLERLEKPELTDEERVKWLDKWEADDAKDNPAADPAEQFDR